MCELNDDLRAFLAKRRYATLATHEPDGAIHLTPIWFFSVFAAPDDVRIVLTPTRWRAWTASDLDEQSFGGILGAQPELWFLRLDA
jgi:hypothetical protein